MRKSLLLLASILLGTPLAAQEDLRDIVEAERVRNFVFLVADSTIFRHEIDGRIDRGKATQVNGRILIAANRRRGFNLLLGYKNPIRYTWSTSESEADDATYGSARRFIEAASTLFTMVGGAGAAVDATQGGATNRVVALSAKASAADSLIKHGGKGPPIVEWLLWYTDRDTCLKTGFEKLVGQLAAIDRTLYGDGATAFRDTTVRSFRAMADADSMHLLTVAKDRTVRNVELLKQLNDGAADTVRGLAPLGKAATYGESVSCQVFKSYTLAQLIRIAEDADRVIAQRRRAVVLLDSVRTRVATELTRNQGGEAFLALPVALTEGKTKEITLALQRRKVDFDGSTITVKDEGEMKVTLLAREAQSLIVEFAAGVIYTRIPYATYGTTTFNGQTVVAQPKENIQHSAAVGMLNLVPKFWSGGFVYPVFQVGVGTGREYPLVLGGGGLRFVRPYAFALTAGWAGTWRQELKSLAPDSVVTGTADIDKDLEYRFGTHKLFYVGVQTGF